MGRNQNEVEKEVLLSPSDYQIPTHVDYDWQPPVTGGKGRSENTGTKDERSR